MTRFTIYQESDDVWWVCVDDKRLYHYPSLGQAREAALVLARDKPLQGQQVTLVVFPAQSRRSGGMKLKPNLHENRSPPP
jgi:hypothetical protein